MATVFPQGLDSFVNPSGSTALGAPNENLKHSVQHQNINDAMAAVQTHIGVSGSTDPKSINFRLNKVEEDVKNASSGTFDFRQIQFLYDGPFEVFNEPQYFKEIIYDGYFVNSVAWYDDENKNKKIFQIEYSDRNPKKQATRIVYTAYNADGLTVKSKMEDIITYIGPREVNRTRTVI